mgnify:CR=1 FL=1
MKEEYKKDKNKIDIVDDKKCKGVTKPVIKNKITHEDYRECASKQEDKYCEMMTIRSKKHEVYTEIANKKAIYHVDNKRISM